MVDRIRHDGATLSEAVIADELGCNPGPVKFLASRARETLAPALAS
jgi:DNA-directed RNA polymerase specialized sigma24 family protein